MLPFQRSKVTDRYGLVEFPEHCPAQPLFEIAPDLRCPPLSARHAMKYPECGKSDHKSGGISSRSQIRPRRMGSIPGNPNLNIFPKHSWQKLYSDKLAHDGWTSGTSRETQQAIGEFMSNHDEECRDASAMDREDPPPFMRTWNRLYALIVAYVCVIVLALYLMTITLNR